MSDKREDALRYLDILELVGIIYFLTMISTFLVVTFSRLDVLLPILGIVLAFVLIIKVFTSWESSKELVLLHANRERIRTWDGESSAPWSGVVFGGGLLIFFGLIHYFFWSDHLGRMLQIYCGVSILVYSDLSSTFEKKFKKQAGLFTEPA